MKLFLLSFRSCVLASRQKNCDISALAVVNARPQLPAEDKNEELVQIEKQEVREINPEPQPKTLLHNDEETKRALSTKEILEKIVEVNRRHGLTPKGLKTNQDYVQIPTIQRSGSAKQTFQFAQTPFSNPIFDYLNNGNPQPNQFRQGLSGEEFEKPTAYMFSTNNSPVAAEDQIPGQYIKRKVTHQQTFIIPSGLNQVPNYFGQAPNYYGVPSYASQFPTPGIQNVKVSHDEDVKKKLENRTVENIKNILNTQLQPSMYAQQQSMYPYLPIAPPAPYPYFGAPQYPRIPDETLQQFSRPGRQWQWPFAQYFPIVIKDPFQQIFNAFTSMIEYGQSTADAVCADEQKSNKNKTSRAGKALNAVHNAEAIYKEEVNTNKPVTMDIEDLQMDNENSMKFTLNFAGTTNIDNRSLKEFRTESPRVNNKVAQYATQPSETKNFFNKKDKNKDEVHSENTKLISKDNTGSGVFIHKLKVRKGGVAIAGPGGIATAGSGGTAIVGPNGYAYTQPDSVAIAGSGTKVIAVDPSINFSELISSGNKSQINPRLGKLVAVGPVVYYNKG